MAQCPGTTRTGKQCTGVIVLPAAWCWWHDPATAGARKKAAAKGGKGRLGRRVSSLWDEIEAVIVKVESGELAPPQGNTVLRGYGALINLARVELDVQERTEIWPLLAELEAKRRNQRGYR